MIVLLAKVGTGPGGHIGIKSKRKPPQVGESFMAMRVYPNGKPDRYGPQVWEHMILDRIDDETGRYFVSLN